MKVSDRQRRHKKPPGWQVVFRGKDGEIYSVETDEPDADAEKLKAAGLEVLETVTNDPDGRS